jgi:enoyl-[acyl-carrier protein] reductase II
MGTRFLVATECTIHQNYKNKVLEAGDTDTIMTGKRLGHPVRSLKNRFSKELSLKEFDASVTNEDFEKIGVGALRRAAREGDVTGGCVMAGQSAGMVCKEQPCAEIIKEVMDQARGILSGASALLG